MKRFSKISIDDIKNIQVDSGVLLKEFDVENPVFLPENVICATNGGINPVCEPEYYDFGEDVDNAKSAKETKRIRGWNVSINFTTFTTSLALIRLALGAADISGKALSLRQRLQYAKDFNDIWWVGKRADDKLLAIRLIRSLSDSGFSLQTTKRGKGKISITLKGHSSFSDKNKIPMEIYVIEESNEPVIPDVPDEPVVPDTNSYLTFASAEPFTLATNNATKCWNGTLYTSTDAEAWNEWDGTTTLASAEDGGEHRLYLRGIGNSRISYVKSVYGYWILDGSGISCIGNIETLLDYKTVASGRHPTMWERCYYRMFYGCTSLVTAPELPATTLVGYCYYGMFEGCTSLVSAPELPATKLAGDCYRYMFRGCTSLVSVPELPATNLWIFCYASMFRECTSLVALPKLPATNLSSGCYELMFSGCTSIKLSATQSDEYHTAYRLPSSGAGTVDSSYTLDRMFEGTGGTFTGTPKINSTYYTSNTVI